MSNHSPQNPSTVTDGQLNQSGGRQLWARDTGNLLKAINSTGWGVLMADPEGITVYANPAFLRLFDFGSVAAVIGIPAAKLFAIQQLGEGFDVQPLTETVGQATMEYRAYKRGGRTLDVEVASTLVRDARGNRVGVLVSFVDRAMRKPAEREREQLIREFREALGHDQTLGSLLTA